MANSDLAQGFELVQDKGGTTALRLYSVDSSNGNIIGKNDAVTLEADGNVTRSAANDGILVLGVVQGIFNSDGKAINFLAASTAGTVLIAPARDNVFKIQSDSGTNVAATAIGATANFAVTGNASAITGVSGMELDASDIGTGLQCRILGKDPDSSFGEDHVKLLVEFNESVGFTGTATI